MLTLRTANLLNNVNFYLKTRFSSFSPWAALCYTNFAKLDGDFPELPSLRGSRCSRRGGGCRQQPQFSEGHWFSHSDVPLQRRPVEPPPRIHVPPRGPLLWAGLTQAPSSVGGGYTEAAAPCRHLPGTALHLLHCPLCLASVCAFKLCLLYSCQRFRQANWLMALCLIPLPCSRPSLSYLPMFFCKI